jgi:hypothetical protein
MIPVVRFWLREVSAFLERNPVRRPYLVGSRQCATFVQLITGLLEERRLLLLSGTIVDATIIAAPSSTKNARASRDPT